MKTFSDLFRYDDGEPDLSANWREFSGPAWCEDNALQLQAGVNQLVYLTADTMDSLEHRAECTFRLTAAKATARVGLMVRAEWTDQSPDLIHRCYLATVDGTGAIAVYSILTSDPTPAAIATGTVTLDTDRAHKLVVKVTDADRSLSMGEGAPDMGAEIKVYVDDQVSPVLTCVDQRTIRPEGRYIGFDVLDSDGAMTARIGEFYGYVLRSAVIRNPQAVPKLDNFGDLIYETAFRLDRAGNSQFDMDKLGTFINRAHQEVWRFTHPWTWGFRITYFTTRDGVRCYELPAYVKTVGGLTDKTNARMLAKEGWKEMRRVDPGDDATGSYSYTYQVLGIGDFGGPVVAMKPIPGGEYFIEMPYYARPIPMVESTDLPLLPPEYNEVLVHLALKRGAAYSDNKTLYEIASRDADMMLAQMRREDIAKRDEDFLLRMRSGRELQRVGGLAGNDWMRVTPGRYRC